MLKIVSTGLALGLLFGFSIGNVHAEDKPSHASRMRCTVIKAAIEIAGGLDAAKEQARARGYSEGDIAAVVKRCRLQ